jgi:hypothetical protein
MGYFDNFNDGLLNKYQKDLKNKKIIGMLFYLCIDGVSIFIQFHYRLILHLQIWTVCWNRRCPIPINILDYV